MHMYLRHDFAVEADDDSPRSLAPNVDVKVNVVRDVEDIRARGGRWLGDCGGFAWFAFASGQQQDQDEQRASEAQGGDNPRLRGHFWGYGVEATTRGACPRPPPLVRGHSQSQVRWGARATRGAAMGQVALGSGRACSPRLPGGGGG